MHAGTKKKVTALVLQGGGALGAYECGVVKALYEQPDFAPDIICGVSIGAFSAAVMAGAREGPVQGLIRLWHRFTWPNMPFVNHQLQILMTLPYNPGMYQPSLGGYFNPVFSTHFCDTTPLKETLDEIVDFDKLNHPHAPVVVISAINIASGELHYFDNRGDEGLTVDQITASGSLPPSFPMQPIAGGQYWDGGLFSNTPLRPAIKWLSSIGAGEDLDKEIILVELFPQHSRVPTNMPEVFDRMTEMLFQNKITFDRELFQRTSEFIELVKALNQTLPPDSPIRQYPAFKRFVEYSKINRLTVIKHTAPEPLLGPSDFTEQTINKRIELGYRNTKEQLHIDG